MIEWENIYSHSEWRLNMKTIVTIHFYDQLNQHKKLTEFFHAYGIHLSEPEKPPEGIDEVSYDIPIIVDEQLSLNTIRELFINLNKRFQLLQCFDSVDFKFDHEDFEKSPFFELCSTGNSPRAFLEHKKNCIKWKVICESCGLKAKVQTSPLIMDTSKIGTRYMVNVGTDYWVLSEKMAQLMEEWKISGYELKEIIHSGKMNGQCGYQVIPTNTLPT